jgi:hypothetical protein
VARRLLEEHHRTRQNVPQKSFIRINEIRAREIRVIDENGQMFAPFEALRIQRSGRSLAQRRFRIYDERKRVSALPARSRRSSSSRKSSSP